MLFSQADQFLQPVYYKLFKYQGINIKDFYIKIIMRTFIYYSAREQADHYLEFSTLLPSTKLNNAFCPVPEKHLIRLGKAAPLFIRVLLLKLCVVDLDLMFL